MKPLIIPFWVQAFGVAGALLFGPQPGAAGGAAGRARLVCANRSYDFGTIAFTQTIARVFTLANSGSIPLHIAHVQACCGLTVRLASANIPPDTNTLLEVTFSPGSVAGTVRKTVYLHTNDPEAKIVAFRLSGVVVRQTGSVALPAPPKLPCAGCR